MLYLLFGDAAAKWIAFFGLILAFLMTCILLQTLQNILPRDGGRAFAVNGILSQGKPRGAGIVFILVFCLMALLCVPIDRELVIYLIMIVAAMLSGYLDDSAKTPWGEYKKGLIDLVIAFVCAFSYVNFNGSDLTILLTGTTVTLPKAVYIILAMILIWASINVTNCTDGVDGLCGSISIVSCLSFFLVFTQLLDNATYGQLSLMMIICLLGYLWFNASPSKLLMGDAGSRALGLFAALLSLKSGSPLLFLVFCIVFLFDGGLGLIKVALLRFLKIKILKNTRTPLHDHARKNAGWSDTQTVFRFVIIQAVISSAYLYVVL
ncbi:MAG: phospho-N-acetylmuramoyl-pentapeptide-transferase [Lachnospiraceae bacterium]|nr:phospho-N-acetylmuramoyl-pentapeptide-transferase [Lachnospiraceae bacterium]